MRNQTMGTWKSPKSLENIAERIEYALLNEEAAQRVYEKTIVEMGRVPEYTSPTGNAEETRIGREIHRRTYGPNPSWDKRGEEALADHKKLIAEDKSRQEELKKGWKSKEQEMDEISERLSTI